ncbi:MAG: hypothetical protein ACD_39C00257G0002 [uncultured bacterium]|nr:MAG: hypothetical protein ACD_39C00257G0002 [uncultured bacterium]
MPTALRAFGQPETAALLPPDPGIMNDAIIQAIFLASFRAHNLVVSFSESLVKQGSAFAYVLSPQPLAAAINEVLNESLKIRPAISRVRQFDRWQLILNVTVLDKLRIKVPDQIKKSAAKLY